MSLSQKCQYALRAVFELAKQEGKGPVKIKDISESQAIPQRFLEGILAQLKQIGVVQSTRGKQGGYLLSRKATDLAIGEIIRIVDGPIVIVECSDSRPQGQCRFDKNCVFRPIWEMATQRLSEVYDSVSFSDLVEDESLRSESSNYII